MSAALSPTEEILHIKSIKHDKGDLEILIRTPTSNQNVKTFHIQNHNSWFPWFPNAQRISLKLKLRVVTVIKF